MGHGNFSVPRWEWEKKECTVMRQNTNDIRGKIKTTLCRLYVQSIVGSIASIAYQIQLMQSNCCNNFPTTSRKQNGLFR